MEPSKPILSSKIFWLNTITFLLALLGFLQGQEFIVSNPQLAAALVAAIGFLNVVLRWFTSEPVTMTGTMVKKK